MDNGNVLDDNEPIAMAKALRRPFGNGSLGSAGSEKGQVQEIATM
jgi:hypothetical protein